MDHYLERMTRSGNWGDTAFLHALACACKVEACFQVEGGPVTFLHILWPSPAPVIKLFFFCITLTLALWSSWLGRLLLRRKLRGGGNGGSNPPGPCFDKPHEDVAILG